MGTNKSLKLIIQIPCWNEEERLAQTLRDIPKEINGIREIETLVIDDGSTDRTVEIAKECKVNHIVGFSNHKGLARTFAAGIETSLKLGADIIVNTDADNQYNSKDMPKLIQPILSNKADMVIGIRDIDGQKHFSLIKKILQKIGSWVVRKLSGTEIKDTTSGFRAYTSDAAVKINVISNYSYTLETIIQAGRTGATIAQVPITTNTKTRKSKLFKNTWQYILYSIATILKAYTIYQPLKIFFSLGITIFAIGFLIGCRYLYFFLTGTGAGGHIQSLILASILIILGFQISILGLLANLISANRFLIENILVKTKDKELKQWQ